MTDPLAPWTAFAQGLDYTSFPPGSRILDVGFGTGWLLRELRAAGYRPVGVEVDSQMVAELRAEGYDVHRAFAEALPVESSTIDGIVCRVVLPYTDERRAINEWGRVLRPGGQVRASYHGLGYYSRYASHGESLSQRAYGVRSILGTWFYAATGRRLPGWLGDTIYQSRRRLARHYREAVLRMIAESISTPFLGRPVYIYHVLQKGSDSN